VHCPSHEWVGDEQSMGWHNAPITADGAPPVDTGAALTSWRDSNFQHIVYLTGDGHVHEIYGGLGAASWGHNDLTEKAHGAPPPADTGASISSSAGDYYQHIVYVTTYGEIGELYFPIGGSSDSWQFQSLPRESPPVTISGAAISSFTLSSYVES